MKLLFFLTILLFLNGCAQNSALLGPIYALGSTGNVMQAGTSYGTSYALKKIEKNLSENKSKVLKTNKTSTYTKKTNIKTDENPEEFFKIVKKHIKKLDNLDTFSTQ
jgi:hypothetical protein